MILRSAVLVIVILLTACRSLVSAQRPPGAPTDSAAAESPAGAAPSAVPPGPTRQFRLGSAASALVAQAHARAAAGDYPAAMATVERALRIEPENPLAWIELGRVQLAAGNPAQADSMGHKALALASGDPNAQSAAWRLIGDSLRARGRNPEASTADAHADALTPR